MKISIGMPVHDALEYTLRAIDCAVVACHDWEYELHVIDDNSTPETHARLAEKLRELDEELITTQSLTPHPPPNLAFNVNWLLDNVSYDADYYLNLETDVFMTPEVLRVLVGRLQTNPDVCMVFPKQLTLDEQRADFHFCQREYPLLDAVPDDLQADKYFKWTHMGCTLVRGEDARNPGIRVDESFKLFCCDQDYSLRLRDVTRKHILYVESVHVIHAGHASSKEGLQPNPDPGCFARVDNRWRGLLDEPE